MEVKTDTPQSTEKKRNFKVYDILIIEDDPIQTLLLKKLFQTYEHIYNPIFKDSIASASTFLEKNEVNAIVSDYNLPDGTGSDLIYYEPDVPIIIMTATKDIDLVVELMKNDEIYDFVLKEYEKNFIEILHRTLQRAIKKFQLSIALENQKALFKQLVENINDVIIETNAAGQIKYTNAQVFELTGYKSLELHSKSFTNLIDAEVAKSIEEFYQTQETEKSDHSYYEFPITTKSGETKWVGQTAKIRLNGQGEFAGFLFVTRDITAKKTQEDKIKEQNNQLQRQNEEIKRNYEELAKARSSRKALGITLVLAIFLFIVSEAFLEPIIESQTGNSLTGLAMKGVIALLLKPFDNIVERFLVKRQIKKNKARMEEEGINS